MKFDGDDDDDGWVFVASCFVSSHQRMSMTPSFNFMPLLLLPAPPLPLAPPDGVAPTGNEGGRRFGFGGGGGECDGGAKEAGGVAGGKAGRGNGKDVEVDEVVAEEEVGDDSILSLTAGCVICSHPLALSRRVCSGESEVESGAIMMRL